MIFLLLIFLSGFAQAGTHIIRPLQESFERDIVSGDINSLKSLIETNLNLINSPAVDQHRNKLLLLAVKQRQTDMVDLLLQKLKVNAASNNNEAIRVASLNGDEDIVKLLLARPEVNPAVNDNEAIIVAAENGHTEVVRQLLKHRIVYPTARDNEALKLASHGNHGDIVKLFFQDGRISDIASVYYSLKQAANNENVDLIRFILSQPFFSQNRELIDMIVFSGDLHFIDTKLTWKL